MLDPNTKTSQKLPNRRSGISNGSTNHRPISRCANKEKVAAMPSNKVSSYPVPPNDSATRKAYDNQIKMKFMNVVPRNPAKETSEGVQEFIKHVSDFIEKKNPFKETVTFSPVRPRRQEMNTASINSIQFNGARKKPGEKKKTEDVKTETNNPTVENFKNPAEKPNLTSLKTEDTVVKGRISRPTSVAIKRDEEKGYQREYSPLRKRSESTPGKNLTGSSSLYQKNKVVEVKSCRKPSQRPEKQCFPVFQSQKKNRRPSEIPLRKNRTDFTKKQNKVSLLMQKPLTGVESESSLDVYTKEDLFPVMEDFGLCSEMQMTINFSSERLSTPGDSQKLSTSEDESDSTDKSPKISIFEDFTKEKTISDKKSKVIDVGRVKTSSFTVLRTSSAVLTKLESLHKQNVHAREKSFSEKTSSKQKAVASKSSANSLKGRNSKKSLQARASNKGNKPGLKKKTKKPNKEPVLDTEDVKMEKKPPETKSQVSYLNFYREIVFESRKTDNKQKREENQPPARKPLFSRPKSPRKQANLKAKEELVKPTIQTNPKPELESPKLEKPKISRNPSLIKKPSKPFLKISNSEEKQVKVVDILKPDKEIPTTPPPTPGTVQSTVISGIHWEQTEEEEEWSAKTMIFDTGNGNFHWRGINSEEKREPEESPAIPSPLQKSHPSSVESVKSTKPKKMDFVVKGTPLTSIKDSSDRTKDFEQPAVKKHLMIDLRKQEDAIEYRVVENSTEDKSNHDLVPGREEKCSEVAPGALGNSKDMGKEGKKNENENFAHDLKQAKPRLVLSKSRKSFSSLKRKPQPKSGTKFGRKKKMRSDAGDRPTTFSRNLFDSKTKPDVKLRSGLKKPTKGEEKRDVFEDALEMKLRRRNSEPISFRGYVWKHMDSAPRGHQPSVSSMTSSLRHLNTDDIDDFILWEAIPQKMTSCWEMSLYHIKRPWSVLSCSVFKDNRMSSTPGLILKNLRNDSRRAAIIKNERTTCRKENPFDVEPSIAQKNIDIRNWLAALNFPTPPSTSTDGFTEGNFPIQLSLDTQSLSKVQLNPKRRKVVSGLKFSEDLTKKKIEDKEKFIKFSKWNSSDGGLTDLIRRKSGGFVTKEQFLHSEHPAHSPNVTVNVCVYSKSAEDSFLMEKNDRSTTDKPRKYKSLELMAQPEVSISATIISSRDGAGSQAAGKTLKVKGGPQEATKPEKKTWVGFLEEEMNQFFSDVNIWKYLFLLTLCLVAIHYCCFYSYLYRQ